MTDKKKQIDRDRQRKTKCEREGETKRQKIERGKKKENLYIDT